MYLDLKKLKNRDKSLLMRNNYKIWKYNALNESAYFVIFQGFLESNILKEISGNAMKLYIYLGINSNNYEGIVWHSNKKIAKYFGKSERTIRTWMKELEDLKLIKRMRLDYDGIVYTYLQPYKNKEKNNDENIGIIYFNTSGFIVFQADSQRAKRIYRRETDISLYIENVGWVDGILQVINFNEQFFQHLLEGFIDLDNQSFNIEYLFNSYDNNYSFTLNKKDNMVLQAKII